MGLAKQYEVKTIAVKLRDECFTSRRLVFTHYCGPRARYFTGAVSHKITPIARVPGKYNPAIKARSGKKPE